jgi:hypothetical protein
MYKVFDSDMFGLYLGPKFATGYNTPVVLSSGGVIPGFTSGLLPSYSLIGMP